MPSLRLRLLPSSSKTSSCRWQEGQSAAVLTTAARVACACWHACVLPCLRVMCCVLLGHCVPYARTSATQNSSHMRPRDPSMMLYCSGIVMVIPKPQNALISFTYIYGRRLVVSQFDGSILVCGMAWRGGVHHMSTCAALCFAGVLPRHRTQEPIVPRTGPRAPLSPASAMA